MLGGSFEAVELFTRIRTRADEAAAAGDFKTAMAGDMFIAECCGYKDSSTLTHEHVKGKPPKADEAEAADKDRDTGTVLRFGKVFDELRRRI